MSFDGLFTHAILLELQKTLLNSRVTKISQPFKNEVILTLRANRKNFSLLLSANPNYARTQITDVRYTNPKIPTNFTMVLRKYLEGSRLVKINQPENDRVLNFEFSTRNELGDSLPLILSIEMMGRHSNIILINQESNQIIDTIKHVNLDQNRYRTLLAGATYLTPPKQNKLNPFIEENIAKISEILEKSPDKNNWALNIVQTYQGFSKASALILVDRFKNKNNYLEIFRDFLNEVKNPSPSIIGNDFTCFKVNSSSFKTFPSLSSLLDAFYIEKATDDRIRQQGATLLHIISQNIKKSTKKLKKLNAELKQADDADDYRIKGELLTTYLYKIKDKEKFIVLPNYYENDAPTKIELLLNLTPSQNAQRYFKKYTKLKNSIKFITEQIELTKKNINYLESIDTQIKLAEAKDLEDIKLELIQQGLLYPNKQTAKSKKINLSKPTIFLSTDGTKILVGKNNLQNDQLSLKTASKNYWWLHVKNMPGSHVIVVSKEPSQSTLNEAAIIAAYFSKAQKSANVAVDYVEVRRLKKPNGAKPGFVTYTGQKTLYVTPDRNLVESLRK